MKRALVVDDSKTMRDLTSKLLNNAGFETICASDGLEALKVLGDSDVALMTVDYNMPNMNGVEFVTTVRKKPKYSSVPILMISTDPDQAVKEQAKAAGASGWVKKPFEASILLSAIAKLCGDK